MQPAVIMLHQSLKRGTMHVVALMTGVRSTPSTMGNQQRSRPRRLDLPLRLYVAGRCSKVCEITCEATQHAGVVLLLANQHCARVQRPVAPD
jgi:hypothetical protein